MVFITITLCRVLLLFLCLNDAQTAAVRIAVWQLHLLHFRLQMFHESRRNVASFLFPICKRILQRYLVEHKDLWIGIKAQRSVRVPWSGCPKSWFLWKGIWANMHHFYGQLPGSFFFFIWLTETRYEGRFDPLQWANWKRKRHTQWGNRHQPHDQSCDKCQTLPASRSPTKHKLNLRDSFTFPFKLEELGQAQSCWLW